MRVSSPAFFSIWMPFKSLWFVNSSSIFFLYNLSFEEHGLLNYILPPFGFSQLKMNSVIQHILLCSCISATGSRGLTRLKSHALGKAVDRMSVDSLHRSWGAPAPSVLTLFSVYSPVLGLGHPTPTPSPSCYLKLALRTVQWPTGYSGALWFSNLSDVPPASLPNRHQLHKSLVSVGGHSCILMVRDPGLPWHSLYGKCFPWSSGFTKWFLCKSFCGHRKIQKLGWLFWTIFPEF